MRKVPGIFLGLAALVLLVGGLFLAMRAYAPAGQSLPAAQPAAVLPGPTPTPCTPVVQTLVPGAVDTSLKPGEPGYGPEMLTPRPILPRECFDQLTTAGTPWPHVDTREPPPFQVTQKPRPPTPRPEDPLGPDVGRSLVVVERAPDYLDPRSPRLAGDAEAIFVGTVSTISPSRWGTRDGRKPATWGEYQALRSANPILYIYTPVTFEVERLLKNTQAGNMVLVTVPGGSVDGVEFAWPDRQLVEAGKRFLVFTGSIPAEHLNRLGLADAIPEPRRTTIALFEVTPGGKVPFATPSAGPQSISVEEAVAAIRAAVK